MGGIVMFRSPQRGQTIILVAWRWLTALVALNFLTGCFVVDFFSKKKKNEAAGGEVFSGTVIGQPLGEKAGGPDESLLASVYAVPTPHAPAAIRPDPDVYVRRLLRQYRPEGAMVARQIGAIEPFRLLLGGATEDFSKNAQEDYDATSLLAVLKVAEEVCRGLVAPGRWEHEGWSSILPYEPESVHDNLRWLAQRFLGMPAAQIPEAKILALAAIMNAEAPIVAAQAWANGNAYANYVPACATLALDAEALYL